MDSGTGAPAQQAGPGTLLWLADIGGVAEQVLLDAAGWLNPAERERHARFVRAARRRQFSAGRVMLRLALGSLLGVPARAVQLVERAGQAPALAFPARPDVGLSISHSGSWVGCAVSMAPVGLDIEQVDPRRDMLGVAAQAFGEPAAAELASMEAADRAQAFYRMWCRHEAHIKLGHPATHDYDFEQPGLALVLSSARPLAPAPELTLLDFAALLRAAEVQERA